MSFVDIKIKGLVGVITINREKAMNALNEEVLDDLDKTMDSIDLAEIRCLILTGAGEKAFVAGADIAQMKDLNSKDAEKFGEKGNRVFRKIERFPVPIIAAVNGFALGGGCELALSCDFRLASENAVFGQPEVSLGITPGFGGTQRLVRTIGVGKAKEMLYSGKNIKAQEALDLGLVNHILPIKELMHEAMKVAERIASNAPFAVRATKQAINEGLQVDIDSGILIEIEQFSRCFTTEDQKEAMTAFVEKRKAKPFLNK